MMTIINTILNDYSSFPNWVLPWGITTDKLDFKDIPRLDVQLPLLMQLSSLEHRPLSRSGQVILKPAHAYYDEYYSYKGFVMHRPFSPPGLSSAIPQVGTSFPRTFDVEKPCYSALKRQHVPCSNLRTLEPEEFRMLWLQILERQTDLCFQKS